MKAEIPIATPLIEDEEIKAVIDVLRSGMLAQGEVVKEFENQFAEYVGVENAIAVSNGTVALDVALKSAGIGKGDEVITTPFSFIATANSILYQRAKPVFADIDEKTFNINPDDVLEKITSKTKAIIGVHLFGHPFEIKSIMEICEDHNLIMVEDSSQAHGAEYEGIKAGSSGIGTFSFYATKNITTGEGGMITTNDKNIAEKCRLLRNHGESSKYVHSILGFNYRMTNIQAAIGVAQLKKIDLINRKRIHNAEYLSNHLKVEGLITPYKKKNVKHVYHQYVVRVTDEFPMSRDEFIGFLKVKSIGSAIHYPLPIYSQPLYRNLGYEKEKNTCPVTEMITKEVLSLPAHPSVSRDDLKYMVSVINTLK